MRWLGVGWGGKGRESGGKGRRGECGKGCEKEEREGKGRAGGKGWCEDRRRWSGDDVVWTRDKHAPEQWLPYGYHVIAM